MEKLKAYLAFYLHNFYLADYLLIALVFFAFSCVLILCIFLRRRPLIVLFLIISNLAACAVVYIYGYGLIDSALRARELVILSTWRSTNLNALIIDFALSNDSLRDFKRCKVLARLYQDLNGSENILQKYKKTYLPVRKKSKNFTNLKKDATVSDRISFENFTENNYSIRLGSECF